MIGGSTDNRSRDHGHAILACVREKSAYRSTKPAEAARPSHVPKPGHNWYDWVDFQEAVTVCRQQGSKVIVGVDQGGAAALRRMALKNIFGRRYKYDWVERPIGVKNPANWMSGTAFIAILIDREVISG